MMELDIIKLNGLKIMEEILNSIFTAKTESIEKLQYDTIQKLRY